MLCFWHPVLTLPVGTYTRQPLKHTDDATESSTIKNGLFGEWANQFLDQIEET